VKEKKDFKEKFGFSEKNLAKNHCVLESVLLKRITKKMEQKEKQKIANKPFENVAEAEEEDDIFRIEKPLPKEDTAILMFKEKSLNL
jgi:hypothetical protein